jgi:Adenomatosis polyposis coli down-regulated 1
LNAGKYSAGGTSSPTFQALFHYFADPVCSNATLTVLATGHYSPGSDSDRVQGATEFDFFVQSVIITVHDESTARNLNGLKVFRLKKKNVDFCYQGDFSNGFVFFRNLGQSMRHGWQLESGPTARRHAHWRLHWAGHPSTDSSQW